MSRDEKYPELPIRSGVREDRLFWSVLSDYTINKAISNAVLVYSCIQLSPPIYIWDLQLADDVIELGDAPTAM